METTPKIDSVGQRVAKQVAKLRGRIPVRELSARLTELGRPILPSGITKLEKGQRRIDVDDLVALALALEVTPTRLLLGPPPSDVDLPEDPETYDYPEFPGGKHGPYRVEYLRLSPEVSVETWEAWAWAMANLPMGQVWRLRSEGTITFDDPERTDAEFRAENAPPPARMMLGHAVDVQEAISDIADVVKDALDQGLTEEQITTLVKRSALQWASEARVAKQNEKRYQRLERGMRRPHKPRPRTTDHKDGGS